MDIQVLQILFQMINFGAVLGLLSYLLYKPVLKILDERAQKIEEGQVAAQKAMTEHGHAEELKKKIKQQAEKDAAKLLDEANKQALLKATQAQAAAKDSTLAEITKLRSAWSEEKTESVKDMKRQFSEAVIATSEKVLADSLDAKTHAKLIDDSFTSLLKSI